MDAVVAKQKLQLIGITSRIHVAPIASAQLSLTLIIIDLSTPKGVIK